MVESLKRFVFRKNSPYEFFIVSFILNSALTFILPNIGKITFLHVFYFAMTFTLSNVFWLLLERLLFRERYGFSFILSHTLILFFFIINAYHYTIFSEHLGLEQIWVAIIGIFTGEAKISLGNYLAFLQQSSMLAAVIWLMLLFLILFPRKRKHPNVPFLLNLKFSASFALLLSGFALLKPGMAADSDLESVQEAIPYVRFVEFDPLYPKEKFKLEGLQGNRYLEKQRINELIAFRDQLNTMQIEAANKPNILFLHLESLRADLLSPNIMPKLYKWGNTKGEILEHHYTTSSNTTAGMFGLLHGLSGSYFQVTPVGDYFPLPLDILKKLGYSVNTYHGKSLSYDNMYGRFFEATQDHDFYGHFGWNDAENDKRVLEQFLQDLEDKELNISERRFDYIKLDSTHWNYTYPPEFEKFLPVIEADFVITSLLNLHMKGFREELFNRYRNAAYYMDFIVSNFLESLETKGYLENTIVVMVGDHGEEFWEHGRFGHIYGLSREQIHVFGLVHFPKKINNRYTMTSHQDIFPTIFSYMNLNMDTEALFSGKDLYHYDENLDFALASRGTIGRMRHYTEAVMSPGLKVNFSLNDTLRIHKVSDLDDEILEDFSVAKVRELILKALEMKTDLPHDD